MVRHSRRMDRCFLPAAGRGGAKVRFPAGPPADPPAHRSQGGQGSGEAQLKRRNGTEAAAAPANRNKVPRSCDPAGEGSEQQGAAEDSRAAQLQSLSSLRVTIQQSSDSRAFGPADRTSAALHCHVCNLTCCSLQVFQEHMSGRRHLRNLQLITQSVQLTAGPLLDRRGVAVTASACRGRRPQRWCDTCQVHFSGDIIAHRRAEQHKVCKQQGRPSCPACQRHFRSPRKFVEHIKSVEHKEQVSRGQQRDQLMTSSARDQLMTSSTRDQLMTSSARDQLMTSSARDQVRLQHQALGCFQEEEQEVQVADEDEEAAPSEPGDAKETEEDDELDPQLSHGSSFVVPVRGFVCRLCSKFFYRETAARHTHCRTHTHLVNLQNHRAQKEEEDGLYSISQNASEGRPESCWSPPGGHCRNSSC